MKEVKVVIEKKVGVGDLIIVSLILFMLGVMVLQHVHKKTVTSPISTIVEPQATTPEVQPPATVQEVQPQVVSHAQLSNGPIVVTENGATAVFMVSTSRPPTPMTPSEFLARQQARQAAQTSNK